MHNDDDMKQKGDEPATKRDLWAVEAAMRKDLSVHETTTRTLGGEVKILSTRMDRLERVVKNVVVEVGGLKAEVAGLRHDIPTMLMRMESRMMAHMDGFMAKTVKVERDQFWLIHRMDKLEDRVSRVEKRAP